MRLTNEPGRIGSEHRVGAIAGRQRRDCAARNRLDAGRTVERVDELAARLPDAVVALKSGRPERLIEAVAQWSGKCRVAPAS